MIQQKSILKYLVHSIEKYLIDNLLVDNNSTYMNSNTNINMITKWNSNKDITSNNFYKKNPEINIEDLF